MPLSYVKPYVKRQKNDMADAEAICETVMRPTMRFVETKNPEQQSVLVLHRIRLMLVRQRTLLSNTIRVHMAEFGIVAPIGRHGLDDLLALLSDLDDVQVPALARRTHGRTDQLGINRQEDPCQQAPSTHGTEWTLELGQSMSALPR